MQPWSANDEHAHTPLGRREALGLIAAGVGAAACNDSPTTPPPDDTEGLWAKDPSPFIRLGDNLETRLESLRGLITPNDLFFVRNHAPTPIIDAARYTLTVGGSGARSEIRLSLDDLAALPSHSLVAYIECAGNWRRFFETVTGKPASGGQWGTGAIGCAEWGGPRLSDVLELAGVREHAVDVNVIGLDDGGWERPMPLAKAMHPDTILAITMNGATLPPDHGFPVRVVLPGWIGSSSVKWVGRIEISTEKVWVKANTTSYVLIGPQWPADQYAPASGAPISTGVIKSALALPLPATLAPGTHRLRGFAYSPHAPIARVEWRSGEGMWHDARIIGDPLRLPYAWTRFEIEWTARAGNYVVATRATDIAGNTQPLTGVHNEKGYLLNAAMSHPITVG